MPASQVRMMAPTEIAQELPPRRRPKMAVSANPAIGRTSSDRTRSSFDIAA